MRRRLARAQDGFTLIEVMVAALILVIGGVALATVLINGTNQSTAAVRESQLINIADQQIEQVRADVTQGSGFAALGLSGTGFPAVSSATIRSTWRDPDKFVTSANCYEIASNYDSVTTSGSNPYSTAPSGFTPWSVCGSSTDAEPLQVLSTSTATLPSGATTTVTPLISVTATPAACPATSSAQLSTPCTVAMSGGQTATVYTYVTDTYECAISTGSTSTACPGLSNGSVISTANGPCSLATSAAASTTCSDARRVTVAVVANTAHTLSRATPVYLSAVFTNPNPSATGSGLGLQVNATGA